DGGVADDLDAGVGGSVADALDLRAHGVDVAGADLLLALVAVVVGVVEAGGDDDTGGRGRQRTGLQGAVHLRGELRARGDGGRAGAGVVPGGQAELVPGADAVVVGGGRALLEAAAGAFRRRRAQRGVRAERSQTVDQVLRGRGVRDDRVTEDDEVALLSVGVGGGGDNTGEHEQRDQNHTETLVRQGR